MDIERGIDMVRATGANSHHNRVKLVSRCYDDGCGSERSSVCDVMHKVGQTILRCRCSSSNKNSERRLLGILIDGLMINGNVMVKRTRSKTGSLPSSSSSVIRQAGTSSPRIHASASIR